MARPRCSRKEPKRLRYSGAIVRRLSMKTRAAAESDGDFACANAASGRDPIIMPAEPASAAPEACFRKDRLEREKRFMCELQSESNLTHIERFAKRRGQRDWVERTALARSWVCAEACFRASLPTRPLSSGMPERR